MNKVTSLLLSAVAAVALSGCKTCCQSSCKTSPFAQYDSATTISKLELKRTSESWDGVPLPDYLQGKPELVVMRYIFPVGSKLPWHHHPVINYGILQQGELTIVSVDGKKQVVHAGEPIVEMVGPIHCGMNTGDKPIVLDMFYLSQKGMPLAVQHPEIQK
ncbi:MAG: cupin domain-containing protein [Victivallales bacterium]|nr:cupin domain-containing protein [Victivallales bacterium]